MKTFFNPKPNTRNCLKLLLTLFICLSTLSLSAQEKVVVVGGSTAAPFSRGASKTSKITEIAYQKRLVGSFYLNDDWAKTDILLNNDSLVLRDINARIDLRNNVLEIKTNKDTLVLPTYRIKSFLFKETAKLYVTENFVKSPTKGFYQVLVDDKCTLLSHPDVKITPADFNIITNTGSRDDKIVKKESFYLFADNSLVLLNKSKSKFKKQFSKNEKIANFFGQNKVKPKSKNFLLDFVNFLNSENLDI
jgi:hypothetical protein